MLWGGFTWWQIVRFPSETGAQAEVAIVLGAATWNGNPSPVFRERLRHAIHLYHTGRVHTLLFTGGTGPGEPTSEAAAGRALALAHGVPAEAILIEDRSTRTRDSLANARDIMAREQLQSALLVSDPLHLKRTTVIAQALGMTVAPSATTTSAFRSPKARRDQAYSETKWLMFFHLCRVFRGP